MDGPVDRACMKCGKPGKPGKLYYKYTTTHIVLCRECVSVSRPIAKCENGTITMTEHGEQVCGTNNPQDIIDRLNQVISKPMLFEPYSPDTE